jgi:hypothetical protein
MEDVTIETIEWQAKEYNHKEKSVDFLWAIGLAALVACGVAIYMGNYVFAIFILVSGGCLIMFSIREPENVNFAVKTEGVVVGKDTYGWKSLKGFNIIKGEPYGKLLIHTSKYFLPIYTIPLPSGIKDHVKESMLKFIPQAEIEESRSMQFAEKIGF